MKKLLNSVVTSFFLFAIAASVLPVRSLAAPGDINLRPQNEFANLADPNLSPGRLIKVVIEVLLIVASVVFFVMLLVGGIRWILSGGDKTNTQNARNQITAALVGLVIVFSAWLIASIIGTIFKVDIFNLTLPSL
jgi:hypothetical protein